MITALMLFAAAAGHIVEADANAGVVRAAVPLQVGDTLIVKRLEPARGAPGRAPYFRWSKAGEARVTAMRPDGMAEVALVKGRWSPGDRVAAAD